MMAAKRDYKNSMGEKLYGATTIIGNLGWNKTPLCIWANKQGLEGKSYQEALKGAMDAGTLVHDMIEADIKGQPQPITNLPDEVTDKAATSFINYLHWKDTVKLEVIASEVPLISEVYQYGGTIDCIAKINGQLATFDWKSGDFWPDHKLQMASYRVLWEENHPEQPLDGGMHLLTINRENASWDHHFRQSLPESFAVFLHLLDIHRRKKAVEKE